MKKIIRSFKNRVVLKPWGQEYNIFNNKKKFSITYLHIKKGFCTSLHSHPNKKTGFLILSGVAEVQLGLYKKNIARYKPMSILVLRPGLFHRIKASKKSDLFALEIETPFIRSDLIRLQDNYGRRNKGYENINKTRQINEKDVTFKIPKKNEKNLYKLNGVNIELNYYNNFSSFKNYDDKSVAIICDGQMVTEKGKEVISAGEIVKSYTLKKLSKYYKIKNQILILKAFKSKYLHS